VVVAILTGAVTYFYHVASEVRNSKLEFVNAQMQKLYGPLYAVSQADDRVFKLFLATRWRKCSNPKQTDCKFFDDADKPTVDEVRRWRHWMKTVFQPLNLKMEETITANTQLVIGDGLPKVFGDLIAHVEAYKALIAGWQADDFAKCQTSATDLKADPACAAVTKLVNTPEFDYPDIIVQCVEVDYKQLKRRQEYLEGSFVNLFFVRRLERSPACDAATDRKGKAEAGVPNDAR
jgi:hypothetical protein